MHGSGIGDGGSGQRRGRWAEFPRGGKRGRHQSSNSLIGTPKARAKKAGVSFVVAGSGVGVSVGLGGGHSGGGERMDVGEEVGAGTEGEYSDVAMRLMMKMGYKEGSGLGKDGEGMREPILAVKRPKQMGLGVIGAVGGKNDAGGGADAGSSGGRVKLVRPRAGKGHTKKPERGRKDGRRDKMEMGVGGQGSGRGKWPPLDPASVRANALAMAGIGGNKHTKREFRSMLAGGEKRGFKRRL